MRTADPTRPWIESDDYERHPRFTASTPERQGIARAFHDDGLVVLRRGVEAPLLDAVRGELDREFDSTPGRERTNRITDAWEWSPAVRRLAQHPLVVDTIGFLLGRPAFAFQTLDFRWGTEQRAHADSLHFDTLPAGFMCGAWVALEAIGAHQGPLRYHPGSHRLDLSAAVDAGRHHATASDHTAFDFDYAAYEDRLAELLDPAGIVECTAEPGDVFLWASALVHGGAPVLDGAATRWSQVTHYFGHGCAYVTPMHSSPAAGRWAIREPMTDAASGRRVPQTPPGRGSRIVWGPDGRASIVAVTEPVGAVEQTVSQARRGAQLARRRAHELRVKLARARRHR